MVQQDRRSQVESKAANSPSVIMESLLGFLYSGPFNCQLTQVQFPLNYTDVNHICKLTVLEVPQWEQDTLKHCSLDEGFSQLKPLQQCEVNIRAKSIVCIAQLMKSVNSSCWKIDMWQNTSPNSRPVREAVMRCVQICNWPPTPRRETALLSFSCNPAQKWWSSSRSPHKTGTGLIKYEISRLLFNCASTVSLCTERWSLHRHPELQTQGDVMGRSSV